MPHQNTLITWPLEQLVMHFNGFNEGSENSSQFVLNHFLGCTVWQTKEGRLRLLVEPTEEDLIDFINKEFLQVNGQEVVIGDAANLSAREYVKRESIRTFVKKNRFDFLHYLPPSSAAPEDPMASSYLIKEVAGQEIVYVLNKDLFLANAREEKFIFFPLAQVFSILLQWSHHLGNVMHNLLLPIGDMRVSFRELLVTLDALKLILLHQGMSEHQFPPSFHTSFWQENFPKLRENYLQQSSPIPPPPGLRENIKSLVEFFQLLGEAANTLYSSMERLDAAGQERVRLIADYTHRNSNEVLQIILKKSSMTSLSDPAKSVIDELLTETYVAQTLVETLPKDFRLVMLFEHEAGHESILNRAVEFVKLSLRVNLGAPTDALPTMNQLLLEFHQVLKLFSEANLLDFIGFSMKLIAAKPALKTARNMLLMVPNKQGKPVCLDALSEIFNDSVLTPQNNMLASIVTNQRDGLLARFVDYEGKHESAAVHIQTLRAILLMMLGDREQARSDFITIIPPKLLTLLQRAVCGGPVLLSQSESDPAVVAARVILLWVYTLLKQNSDGTDERFAYPVAFTNWLLQAVFDGGIKYEHLILGVNDLLDQLAGLLLTTRFQSSELLASIDSEAKNFLAWSSLAALSHPAIVNTENHRTHYNMTVEDFFTRYIHFVEEDLHSPLSFVKVIILPTQDPTMFDVKAMIQFSSLEPAMRQLDVQEAQSIKVWHANGFAHHSDQQNNRPDFSDQSLAKVKKTGGNEFTVIWNLDVERRRFYLERERCFNSVSARHVVDITCHHLASDEDLLSVKIYNDLCALYACAQGDEKDMILWVIIYLNGLKTPSYELSLLNEANINQENAYLVLLKKFLKAQGSEVSGKLGEWLNRDKNRVPLSWWLLGFSISTLGAAAGILISYFVPSLNPHTPFDTDLFGQNETDVKITKLIWAIQTIFPYWLDALLIQTIVFVAIDLLRIRRQGRLLEEEKQISEIVTRAAYQSRGPTMEFMQALLAIADIAKKAQAPQAQYKKIETMSKLFMLLVSLGQDAQVPLVMQELLLQTKTGRDFLKKAQDSAVNTIGQYGDKIRSEVYEKSREKTIKLALMGVAAILFSTPYLFNHYFSRILDQDTVTELLGDFLTNLILSAGNSAASSAAILLSAFIAGCVYIAQYFCCKRSSSSSSSIFSPRGYAPLPQDIADFECVRSFAVTPIPSENSPNAFL